MPLLTADVTCSRDADGKAHVNIPQRIRYHSPSGIEWGYGGSGPADLALNILSLYVEERTAYELHQQFKQDFITVMPHEGGTIKQLPEFEEHLHLIKEEAEKRVADAMQMVVSEETVKTVKKVRAELNSEFSALEQSRIAAKKAVMEPYEKLEAIYKTCVTDVYGPANEQLGSKIADVENGLKEAKKEKVLHRFRTFCPILPGRFSIGQWAWRVKS